jgi:type I restriction enzyme S subunit
MQHIKRSALDQVFTITAPPAVINEFSAVASTLNKHLVLLTQQTQNLRRTRDLLLPRLLSGQLDVGAEE